MSNFYTASGFSFQDFDLMVEDNILYASYVKKVPYPASDSDARQPNRYALAKSHDGISWQEVADIIMPVPNSWEESIWAGSISKQNNKYIIYYTGVKADIRNDSCKIGKAYSTDLINWEKDQDNPVLIFGPDSTHYSDEPKLAFRDPFPFVYQDKRYILFCAKDKNQPAGKQGCIGIIEEIMPNQFKWLPPIFSPGIYFDGLECPALYELEGKWYLLYGIDRKNDEKAFRYAIGTSPFGPFKTFNDNQLLSSNNYNCRITNFKGKKLLYHWFRDTWNGMTRERLAPPKEVHILDDGRLSLSDIE